MEGILKNIIKKTELSIDLYADVENYILSNLIKVCNLIIIDIEIELLFNQSDSDKQVLLDDLKQVNSNLSILNCIIKLKALNLTEFNLN